MRRIDGVTWTTWPDGRGGGNEIVWERGCFVSNSFDSLGAFCCEISLAEIFMCNSETNNSSSLYVVTSHSAHTKENWTPRVQQ